MKTANRLTHAAMRKAELRLCESDPIMATLIKRHGRCSLAKQTSEPFNTLASSIIGQQLSAKAADTIRQRVAKLVPTPFQPEEMLKAEPERLREAGLSSRKISYIRELAERVCDGRLCFEAFSNEENETVINSLAELPGIGRWTAEMFLIFGLKRPDVLAVGDAGLQRAARLLYGKDCDLLEISAHWQPYSSVASWYLWRHLDS